MSNRYKRYEPTQSIIHTFDPAETFPNGTFERFLVNIINQLDLSGFENSQEDRGGETPFDPRSLLGIIFYSYCNSCFSARKMEKNCEHHMGYIFVSGYNTPEHSTISRFLNKYELQILDLFAKILYLADKSGFIDYNLIAIDGTKIKANASERFLGTIDDFKKREAKLTEKIQEAIEKQKCADADEERNYWKKKKVNYEKDQQKISAFLKNAQRIKTESNTEIKQNIGDNDSRILKFKRGEFGSGYNVQAASCNSDFILAAEVSNIVSDTKNFDPLLKKVQESVPQKRKVELEDSKFLLDNGYYSADNIINAEKKGINVYIADGQSKDVFADEKNKDKSTQRCIGSKDCELNITENGISLQCPGGRSFDKYAMGKKNGEDFYRFIVEDPEKCESCKFFKICTGKYKNHKNRKEFKMAKKIVDNYEIIERHRDKLHSKEGRISYSRRMPMIEKVFGYITGKLGLYRFSRKGIKKVRLEWYLGCMAYNLKRMYNLQYQPI